MKKLVLNIGLSLLTLLGVLSCNIKEDISGCKGSMILDYSAYSDVILDDINDDEQINVFIFCPENGCIEILTFTYGELKENGFEFELPITYSGHNAVVWQGLNGDDYDSTSMAMGHTYEEFFLNLISAANTFKGVPDPLWATQLEPIEFCAKITRHRVYMRRLHTEINVTLQERLSDGTIVDLDPDDYSFRIENANGTYHTDYTIDEGNEMITYVNDEEEVGTLRISPDSNCILTIDGLDRKIDLVKYMLDTKDNNEISDQEFLDLNKVWDIKIIVKETISGFVAIGLKINGWVVWFSESELS